MYGIADALGKFLVGQLYQYAKCGFWKALSEIRINGCARVAITP